MRSVGVRELKNRLSEYLRLAQAGEEILVTDREEVIAELVRPRVWPVAHPRLDPLVRQGLASSGAKNRKELYPRMSRALRGIDAAALLDQERGSR